MEVPQKNRSHIIDTVASRMKFPQLFAIVATLFVVDLIVPDLIPFVDEIVLGLLTTMLAMWRERAPMADPKPPEKNITPPQN